jgi:hypothetical protein
MTGPHLAVIADQLADRLTERLAPWLVELVDTALQLNAPTGLTGGGSPARAAAGERDADDDEGLWTAKQVAAQYQVKPSFVYQHADELGCIRLGSGKCARLRFDPQVVRNRLPTVSEIPTVQARARTNRDRRPHRAPRRIVRGYELLDFEREP